MEKPKTHQKRDIIMKKLAKIDNNVSTMTSLELLAVLNKNREKKMELKHLHESIKELFEEEIKDGRDFRPSVDSRGYVQFYTLDETQSVMLVASKDKQYLRKIVTYWLDRKNHGLNYLKQEIRSEMAQEIAQIREEMSKSALVAVSKKSLPDPKVKKQIKNLEASNQEITERMGHLQHQIVTSGAHEVHYTATKTAEALTKLSSKLATQAATLRKTASLVNILHKHDSEYQFMITVLKEDMAAAYTKLGLKFDWSQYDL